MLPKLPARSIAVVESGSWLWWLSWNLASAKVLYRLVFLFWWDCFGGGVFVAAIMTESWLGSSGPSYLLLCCTLASFLLTASLKAGPVWIAGGDRCPSPLAAACCWWAGCFKAELDISLSCVCTLEILDIDVCC